MIWHWVLLFLVAVDARIVFESDSQPQNISQDNVLQLSASMDAPTKARADKLLSRAIERLSLEMENAILKTSRRDNIVFSPMSIACALALVLLGSQGVTFNEVANLLGVSAGIDLTGRSNLVHEELGSLIERLRVERGLKEGFEVSIANAVFVQRTFRVKEDFINNSRQIYKSEVLQLDFLRDSEGSRRQINNWVYNRTHRHIKELFHMAPSSLTKVILANAIYFNGQWEYPFYPENITKIKPFHVSPKEVIDVPTMVNNAEIPYFMDANRNCTIIGLPYKHNLATMFIVVPDDNIRDLLNNLSVSDLEELVNSTNITSVIYFVPKMKLESTVNLRHPLEELGVKSLFNPEVSNLSGIAENVFANEAVHKVEIEVTETGTVAAAATAINIYRDGTTPVVKVDKPFLFFIRHNETGVILFWGTVNRPQWQSHHSHLNHRHL